MLFQAFLKGENNTLLFNICILINFYTYLSMSGIT